MTPQEQLSFWRRVDTQGECWNWTGGKTSEGYGELTIGGCPELSHRFIYRLFVGPIPEGLMIDHVCRNRGCVNPEHLRVASAKQNGENRVAPANSRTGVRGVQALPNGRYRARVKHNGVDLNFGHYETLEEAQRAVIRARNLLYTHNTPDRGEAAQ